MKPGNLINFKVPNPADYPKDEAKLSRSFVSGFIYVTGPEPVTLCEKRKNDV